MRGIFAFLLMTTAALAANDSAYTDFDLKACKEVEPAPAEGQGSAVYECKGYKGLPVTFAEDDLRSFVAFGKDGRNHCGFRQTFGGFNSVGNKVEWRLKDGKPIAAILRWSVSYDSENSEKQKSWLVISKLNDRDSCQMAFVEGGYPNANEKARDIADTMAEGYSCETGQLAFFANPGTETDNITTAGACAP